MKVFKVSFIVLLIMQSVSLNADTIPERKGFWQQIKQQAGKMIESFTAVDTNYVEPQHYKFTMMLQNTNTYEKYRLENNEGQTITLAPSPSVKVGPFVGYQWIFLGYTVDLRNFNENKDRTEIDLSLYSSRIGIDLFYRKMGNHYYIRNLFINHHTDTKALEDLPFNGFQSSIKGFNLYYIFNNKRFSYPAAFSQSTVQRKSAGSFLAGIGYTLHQTSIDIGELNRLVKEKIQFPSNHLATNEPHIVFGDYRYTDFSVSAGYGYNWVFAHNWLLASSVSAALGYKQSDGDIQQDNKWSAAYHVGKLNVDALGRFGLVWNNTKWYAGTSAIIHYYRFNRQQLTSNTLFGNLNIYVGFNFGRYKKQ
ncbi:DUF4421 domain-containing protein [Hoylesella timonensis]|uniref:DUF4421 domain-containing protein n=1 Tax=Hoylesella timonensis TaxID=386414 RepID=UPI0018986191|nr:DUF4421 domain-containing protein [Hoylesella timonensis]